MFSERVPRSLQPNRITNAMHRARDARRPLIDLTVTNPTTVGLTYPSSLLAPLAASAALTYQPEPFGLCAAREAVAGDYARRGITVRPDHIALTASTSEAYALLFKLLCDPGDIVLVPVPSYPLFDHLTALEGVRGRAYKLEYHVRWSVDLDDLDGVWTDDVRAVLAVSPNNPTGSVLTTEEQRGLETRCAARHAALIVDEVFADFALGSDRGQTVVEVGSGPSLTPALRFRLGGLSKSVGLPQLKLGWIAIDGPDDLVGDAVARLEIICDTYLSVSTPVQVAAADLLIKGADVRDQIRARINENYCALRAAAQQYPAVDVLETDAGWSAVIRIPSTRSEEDLVVDLIERDGVVVHPGFFFDFPHEAFIVCSLLPEPAVFSEGLGRVLERVNA
jgi:aspartate/methionine/tyrosine aminotransferase